jgi:hypothetical protein
MSKPSGSTGTKATATDAPDVSGQGAEGSDPAVSGTAKAARTIKFRGRDFPVHKVTKNVTTGAIYDHFQVDRQVTNRKNGSVSIETVGHKKRRAGTGLIENFVKEVEIVEE